MSVEEFVVKVPSGLALIPLIALVVTGAVLIALALITGRHSKTIRRTFFVLLLIGIVLVGFGVFLYFITGVSSSITVGSGYVSITSPGFAGAGNLNVTSSQIISAYVAQVGSGNLTLSKQHGTNFSDLNVGVFSLGNGRTAHVVSNNSTDVIVQLTTGEYLILGPTNTQALAESFSQNVYPLGNP